MRQISITVKDYTPTNYVEQVPVDVVKKGHKAIEEYLEDRGYTNPGFYITNQDGITSKIANI